jgi:hypothetical protein
MSFARRFSYEKGIRFRQVVCAWAEDAEGETIDGTHVERVVCVEVDVFPAGDQCERAKAAVMALMKLTYPKATQFDAYNLCDEVEDPAAVLGFVTGFADGVECFESHPLVAFRQEHDPAKYRRSDSQSWREHFARGKTG